jgi:uncharacterized cupin superfamily protein
VTYPNIYNAELEYDPEDPPGWRGGAFHLSRALGGEEIAMKLFEIPPGEQLCPYHYEFVEEWLILLEGDLELRTPTGTSTIERGDVVRFPAGPEGAHKVGNTGKTPARLIMFSSSREPSVAVYPDSDKIGVWAGDIRLMRRLGDGELPYYDGEAGG